MRLDGIPLWDGTELRGPVDLSWEPDRITDVSPAAPRHDDLCVIPGLVDTHVHLIGHAGPGDPPDFATWPLVTTRDEQVLHGVAHAQRAMRHGVTTLRDLAGDEAQVALRRAFDAGVLQGPRVQVHGVVGMTAGHNDLFVPPASPLRKPTADGPDECRKLVRTWARAGMDGIKLTTSGGVLSIGDRNAWRNYTRDEIRAVVDEAHALGMPVASHAHSEEGIRVAVEEGVDSIEHGTLMSTDLAEVLAARRTPVAPTLLINEAIAEGRVPVTPEARAKAAELVATRDVLLAQAAALGVRFVLGTDANGHHVQFGDQLAEVRHMARILGMDAASALRAATSDAADSIGLPVGRIAPGLGADLIVLRGRPWERIDDLATGNIVAVVSRGAVVAGGLP
ncbi:metal-dependent hydrolase family protein [Nonomuraea diastatica]|uniref:Amidohydrolase family protein n=1 Tax=Nonomuraea diastatica TaxID=1848329 RepID=A0A4R4X7L6_9ACTN|nr:amidohydrolase family protein [Nonomuraea diastatica]TDD26392.1 amidohydrolase family protein [Nonomuraea diastatica]